MMKESPASPAEGNPAVNPVELIFSQRTFIMGVAMLGIILFHQAFVHHIVLIPFKAFGHFGVELFFFLSGMGVASSLSRNSPGKFYRNRVLRLLPAWALVMFITYVVDSRGQNMSLSGYVSWFFVWWFLNCLLVFYVLSPWLFRWVSRVGFKGIIPLIVVIETLAVLYVMGGLPGVQVSSSVGLSIPRLPVYLLGMYACVASSQPAENRALPWKLPLALALVAVLLRLLAFGGGHFRADSSIDWVAVNYVSFPLMALAAFPLCYALAWVGKHMAPWKLYGLLLPFGTLSLELFLWHVWIFRRGVVMMWEHSYNGWVCLAVAFALSLVLSWVTHGFCARLMAPLNRRKG